MSTEIKQNRINQQGAVPCSFICRGNTVTILTRISIYYQSYSTIFLCVWSGLWVCHNDAHHVNNIWEECEVASNVDPVGIASQGC